MRYNSFFSIYNIIEEAITNLGSDRPTAYSASNKLGGRINSLETFLKQLSITLNFSLQQEQLDSLETFLKQLSVMQNFQLLGKTIRPISLALLDFPLLYLMAEMGAGLSNQLLFYLYLNYLGCVMAEMGAAFSNQLLFYLYLNNLTCVWHFNDSINQIKNSIFSIPNQRYLRNYPLSLSLSLSWSTTLHISHNQT